MNIMAHSIAQPTGQQFDFDACRRWEGEGGQQQPPFDGKLSAGRKWALRIGTAPIWKWMADSCMRPLDWLVSSDGRVARDTRELFGIPRTHRNACLNTFE